MEEKKKNFSHSVFLEQRERGKITGVSDVRSFDEKLICLGIRQRSYHDKRRKPSRGTAESRTWPGGAYREDRQPCVYRGENAGAKSESLLSRLFQ
mgnify:CR=1 FL=1